MQDDWSVDYYEPTFAKSLRDLGPYEQAVMIAAIEHVLTRYGIDICQGEWGKPLKGNLYEFRVKKSLRTILEQHAPEGEAQALGPEADRPVLLRAFCTFHGSRVVLLFSAYDKRRDSSAKRQNREIKAARAALRKWKREL